ncbi:MAG: YigZ family protein [Clostridia bacterium]|nr:YigZ family protein [Clostridia bacterium]
MADRYVTLAKAAEAEIVEKKSVFIAYAARATTEEEAQAIIRERSKQFSDATHNVYAYYLRGGAIARYSDDGEPQGTSGIPTLNVLKMSGADDLCVVVTRYFGGTLLGAGGLVRAYSAAARAAIEAAGIVAFDRFVILRASCSYSEYQKLQYELDKIRAIVDSVEYGATVDVTFAVKHDKSEAVQGRIVEMFASRVPVEVLGERYDADPT